MHFRQTRLVKPAAAVCGSVMALAMLTAPAAAAVEEEEPIVRTEEDYARGKQNVRSVIEELTELFTNDEPVSVVQVSNRQILPPYSKIIDGTNGRSTLIFRPRFTSAKPMYRALDGIITGSTYVEPLEEQNELIINAPTEEIKSYQNTLEAMDIPSPQILIEAKVVEVMFSDGMQRNLSLMFQGNRYQAGAQTQVPGNTTSSTSGATGNFTPYAGKDSMNIAFQWLETAEDATVLSSPNILISRNETSRIVTGEEIPIQEATNTGTSIQMSTSFKEVGVTLEVEPSMINRDNVTLRVYPKVSNVQRYENISSGGANYSVPVISARSVESYIRMQDKQVVMMGGLYSNRTTLQQERVPFLSDLPYIGELFTGKNESKEVTQLVFFLKIHIIQPDHQVANGIYYDFDNNAKVSEKLGEIVTNADSFPMRERSLKRFRDEVVGALPGAEAKKRQEFKSRPVTVNAAEESPAGPEVTEPSKEPGLIDDKPAVKVYVEKNDAASDPAAEAVTEEE